MPENDRPSEATGISRAELFGIVFVTGAVVMCIEIMGTRVIGPIFGVSLFVWSALLAITLASLAVGYYVGGVWVDRHPTPRLLGALVLSAGVSLGLVPFAARFVLEHAEAFGPRAGALFAASLLFGPASSLLGTVGPIAVRLGAGRMRGAGQSVGSVYAVSTAGSLLGTLATGFVLVPAFETNQILSGAAIALALVGGASLAIHWSPAALALAAAPFFSQAGAGAPLPRAFAILARSQSLYGLVEVIDDHAHRVRFLRSDHSVIGAQFLADRSSAFAFTHVLEATRFIRPASRDVLQIGLGAGSLPSALAKQGLRVDVVEIDPAVVTFAGEYFAFTTRGRVYEEDARTYLQRTTERYDVVVHDTFTGGTTPEHLLSLEVLQRIRKVLRPGGLLAVNFAGYDKGPKAEASRAVMRTLRAAFSQVRAFRDSAPPAGPGGRDGPDDEAGNLVFFASDAALDFGIPASAAFENDACESTLRSFHEWEVLKDTPDGALVTDARNPLARLQLPVAEDHFRAMNALLPVEVWLQ